MTVEQGRLLAHSIYVGAQDEAAGTLTISGGSAELSLNLQVGDGGDGFRARVLINGGQLVATNGSVAIGNYPFEEADVSVSGGLLAANEIDVGGVISPYASGSLSINNGSLTALTGITIGDCVVGNVGYFNASGGQVIVTNATGTGFINIQKGQLTVSGGILQIDTLVMTNSCSQFVHTGGSAPRRQCHPRPERLPIVVSATRQSNDVLVSWLMAPGATNALQASIGTANGSYTTNTFTDIFVVTNNTTTATLTNFLDLGADTNKSRYYRARLSL